MMIVCRRPWHTLEAGFAVATDAMLVRGKQVQWRAEAMIYALMRHRLDQFDTHAMPPHAAARDCAIRRDIHR
jgi:hypothetical protein